ncbi:hypothetical protein CK203_034077 [Vitis vinifera]|uniref:DUF659 domain-containing protein n=1 Tax=Vitis vinifera TaxID=29760 RepID=A0A438IBI7_VITVI|nr:hypothetical protein CK203_034077 [Vitis vinifera]
MLDVISAIALGYKGPNYHQLRVNLLKDAKKEVQLLMDSYRAIWAKVGCTIMDDGWTDNRQRTLINFLVYCPEGILFVKFVDVSFIVKDDISKMDHVAELVRRASKVTTFVYNHVTLLSWLRKRDGWTEILRPGATRFATTFIALKNLNDHKHDLQALENFRNKPTVIGGVMDVIDQKVLKGKFEIMNEMKLFRDRLGSFGRDLAYSSREPTKLDVEELENLLYEEGSIPINEVEGSSSHIDDEDGGGVAIEGLDVENFSFPDAHFQSSYSNFQNE